MNRKKLNEIMDSADVLLGPAGFECIEAQWCPKEESLRLFVDRPGGVDMTACVEATRLLREWQPFPGKPIGSFGLEVSSPGVERPLRRRKDLAAHLNADVSIRIKITEPGQRRSGSGLLKCLDANDLVTVDLEAGQGEWTFPFMSIEKAHLVHRWDS